VHEVTKETPFFMVYGRDMNGPTDATLREWKAEKLYVKHYTEEVIQRMEKARRRMKIEGKRQKEAMKRRYDEGRKESDYRIGDLVWLKNREVEIGQHHKMAKKWKGPYRIIGIHADNTSVVELRSVWNRQDERNVNVALLKRAFVREGQQIPQDVERPNEETKVEKEAIIEEKKGSNKGIKRKRGRRGGKEKRTNKKKDDCLGGEEGEGQVRIRNKEGRTKYTQAVRDGERDKGVWTEEEEDKEYQLKEIMQEIELEDGSIQYRIQFEGFTKLSDARWFDRDRVEEDWPKLRKDWERKKRIYRVIGRNSKQGRVISLRRKK
jgi:hypothetical protein